MGVSVVAQDVGYKFSNVLESCWTKLECRAKQPDAYWSSAKNESTIFDLENSAIIFDQGLALIRLMIKNLSLYCVFIELLLMSMHCVFTCYGLV